MLNIVGHGMRGGKFEQDLLDMDAQPTADMARRHPGVIVGIKTAHYSGPEWAPVERAVEAGTLAASAGDGGLRLAQARAPALGARHEQAAPWRHLHAHVFRDCAESRIRPAK